MPEDERNKRNGVTADVALASITLRRFASRAAETRRGDSCDLLATYLNPSWHAHSQGMRVQEIRS